MNKAVRTVVFTLALLNVVVHLSDPSTNSGEKSWQTFGPHDTGGVQTYVSVSTKVALPIIL